MRKGSEKPHTGALLVHPVLPALGAKLPSPQAGALSRPCTSLALPCFTCWLDLQPAYATDLCCHLGLWLTWWWSLELLFFRVSHGAVLLSKRTRLLPAPLSWQLAVPAWWRCPMLLLLTLRATAGPFLSCIEVLSLLTNSCRDFSGCKKDYFEGRFGRLFTDTTKWIVHLL